MTSVQIIAPTEHQSPAPHMRREPRDRVVADIGVRPVGASALTVATLFDDPRLDAALRAVQDFGLTVGAPLLWRPIPSNLARSVSVGRIGVARDAITPMLQQRVVIGATFGADSLAPVTRLWRGLQRRADVLVDMRRCATLPGSAAASAGIERDVVLFSQRVIERGSARRIDAAAEESADQWTRARHAAEIAYRVAGAENRPLLLVLPVGRSTESQRFFTDALERHARLHRLTAPRIVKAGLLSALLTGDTGRERWLVASVMTIEALSRTADEAIGDTGPWPVLSLGREASFYAIPKVEPSAIDVLPFLLVLESLLHRGGRLELATQLMDSAMITSEALARMVEELGAPIALPVEAFLGGVLANWGRSPIGAAPRPQGRSQRSRSA